MTIKISLQMLLNNVLLLQHNRCGEAQAGKPSPEQGSLPSLFPYINLSTSRYAINPGSSLRLPQTFFVHMMY